MIAKTKIEFDFADWDKLLFKNHDDYDLAGHVDAIAIKSVDGSVHNFYREGSTEDPENYSYTSYYKVFKKLIDFFEIDTTRVRIHRQLPGKNTPLHTDDNNVGIQDQSEYNLRLLTALTEDDNFIYQFEYNGEIEQIKLKKGESVVFDPDMVAHGMANQSENNTRYALIQIFKAYPVTPWLKNFLYKEQTIKL